MALNSISTRPTPAPEQPAGIFSVLIESGQVRALKSLHIIPDDASVTLKAMVNLEGETRWRWVQDASLHVELAKMMASTLAEIHATHHPEQQEDMSRWVTEISSPSTDHRGISLMIGMS